MELPPKPVPVTLVKYDYTACRDYLQAKYGHNEFDAFPINSAGDCLCFWHWVVDNYHILNDCSFIFSREALKSSHGGAPEWVKIIYETYLDEFANEAGEITLHCHW